MKRRTFLKALGALAAAFSVPITLKKEEEHYDHWNQPLKGVDRRRWLPRSRIFSYLRGGPEGKFTKIG